jgi:transaldolase
MGPVCTIMVGRLDDWLKVVANRDDIVTEPHYLEWAGVAAMKKAYGVYQQKGYRLRLLSAATRNHMHWSEFIGGDVVVTLTHEWQKRFNASDIDVVPRMDIPVDLQIVDGLYGMFEDFRRSYDKDGMTVDEFDNYGPNVKTLRQFIDGYHALVGTIRDMMLPNPGI